MGLINIIVRCNVLCLAELIQNLSQTGCLDCSYMGLINHEISDLPWLLRCNVLCLAELRRSLSPTGSLECSLEQFPLELSDMEAECNPSAAATAVQLVARMRYDCINPLNAKIFLYKQRRPKGFYPWPPKLERGVMASPRMSILLFNLLSTFSFRSRSRKPMGGFISYCTHTFLRGCRCAFCGIWNLT